MNKTTEALKLAEEALQRSKRNHYYCEDTWYSCPKAEDGCANDAEGDDCNCGADVLNAENDKAIAAIREALAEQEKQEPVADKVLRLLEPFMPVDAKAIREERDSMWLAQMEFEQKRVRADMMKQVMDTCEAEYEMYDKMVEEDDAGHEEAPAMIHLMRKLEKLK